MASLDEEEVLHLVTLIVHNRLRPVHLLCQDNSQALYISSGQPLTQWNLQVQWYNAIICKKAACKCIVRFPDFSWLHVRCRLHLMPSDYISDTMLQQRRIYHELIHVHICWWKPGPS